MCNRKAYSEWAQIVTCIIAALGLYVAYSQLSQLNEDQRWKNYTELNSRYADLYREFPKTILIDLQIEFSKTSPATKRAVRQYFDLYSEEFWLYQEALIPKEMWTQRIRNGAMVNLNEYSALISGYYYWKEKGAFKHPAEFQVEIEKQIAEVCRNRPAIRPC